MHLAILICLTLGSSRSLPFFWIQPGCCSIHLSTRALRYELSLYQVLTSRLLQVLPCTIDLTLYDGMIDHMFKATILSLLWDCLLKLDLFAIVSVFD